MIPALAPLVCSLLITADPYASITGTWRVLAVFEDGQSIPDRQIATELIADGRIIIDGPMISILVPGSFEPKKLAFTVDNATEPKEFNLVGTQKVGTRGIYLQSGDTLMICLPGTGDTERPKDFGASKGTGRILMTFRRATNDPPAPPMPPPPATRPEPEPATLTVMKQPPPNLPPPPTEREKMQSMLKGSWGHQNDDQTVVTTLNPDGTFSYVLTWKKGMKRVFNSDVRSSGTWRLENGGVIVARVTQSTERDTINQIFSWRVLKLGDSNLIAVDQQGRTRHEWRVR